MVLDALRGVAAILVVCYHLIETYYGGGPRQPLNHGYLAVDFFFILSGFVVGYAYDDRWKQMTHWSFIKRRFIRLHPLLVCGTVLGALLFFFGASAVFPMVGQTAWWIVVGVMLWCCTGLPLPHTLDVRGWAETNPLNGSLWSLQWEYAGNLLYAFLFRHFSKRLLTFFVALFAALTLMLCLNIDPLGILAARSGNAYTVVGGWSTTADQLLIGATRLLFPFFGGLLLSRCGWRLNVRGNFWLCAAAIIVILAMPWMGLAEEGDGRWTNGLYEACCILLLFPIIVATGAGNQQLGKRTTAISRYLGEISYPLYVVQYPFIYMQMAWAQHNSEAPTAIHITVAVATFLLALATATAVYRLYDLPVRAWLKSKLF